MIFQGVPQLETRSVSEETGCSLGQCAYLIEDLPQDRALHFGIEFTFAAQSRLRVIDNVTACVFSRLGTVEKLASVM